MSKHRIFWMIVVITCFTLAYFILAESFNEWENSPVTSNVVMLRFPLEYIPDVTICPPASNTKFGYDFKTANQHKIEYKDRHAAFFHFYQSISNFKVL